MLTKTDFKKLHEIFATKEDLKQMSRKLATKKDLENYSTKNDLDHAIKDFKETVISFKDEILHEIKAMREELAIITGYKDQIEDHEDRIDSIEKKLQISAIV